MSKNKPRKIGCAIFPLAKKRSSLWTGWLLRNLTREEVVGVSRLLLLCCLNLAELARRERESHADNKVRRGRRRSRGKNVSSHLLHDQQVSPGIRAYREF